MNALTRGLAAAAGLALATPVAVLPILATAASDIAPVTRPTVTPLVLIVPAATTGVADARSQTSSHRRLATPACATNSLTSAGHLERVCR